MVIIQSSLLNEFSLISFLALRIKAKIHLMGGFYFQLDTD